MSQTRFDKMVKLRDGRSIGIRRIREDDVPLIQDFHRLLGAESCRMFRAHPHTEEAVKTHVDRFVIGQDWGYLGIADDKAVAYFFLWSVGDNVPVLGICIADKYQNVGLGS